MVVAEGVKKSGVSGERLGSQLGYHEMEFLRLLLFGEGNVTKNETWKVFEAVKASLRIETFVEGNGCFDNHWTCLLHAWAEEKGSVSQSSPSPI